MAHSTTQGSALELQPSFTRKVFLTLAPSFALIFVLASAGMAVAPKCVVKQHAFHALTAGNGAWHCRYTAHAGSVGPAALFLVWAVVGNVWFTHQYATKLKKVSAASPCCVRPQLEAL